ncbi:inactive ubiquitin thioesterase OTULINL isoform X2 [Strix uralensis]|uniref:inactive ubiquitin thioesterase OTULINL isoform X2 n=1 Tax=Strix uralensis TaxID=36305 RepID=UPI003DA54C0D
MQRRHDRKASKNRDPFSEQEKRSRINHSKRSVGRHEVRSWTTATKQSLCLMWKKVKVQLMLSMSFLVAVFWYCRRLYSFLAQLLKRWSNYLQRKFIRNLSVLTEVDLLGYSAREWKGETKHAKHMREAYEELFWSCHIKYLRQVRRDNYCVLRAVLFQIFSQGIPFPSWMKERDILKWTEISATKDHEERGNMCNTLFSDESKEHKLYEAIKFIMLYEVVEAYEQIKNREEATHNLFSLLLARDSSSDPLSFMMNRLNSIGDSICLDQVELFLLGYLLEVKIRVYRLHRFNTEEFQVNYPEEYRREWNEISLLTEDDRYYHIPLFRT